MATRNNNLGDRNLAFQVPMLVGNDVLKLQKTLVKGGYLNPRYADGRFNLSTRQALMTLEAKNELIPRGYVPEGDGSAVLLYLNNLSDGESEISPEVVEVEVSDRPARPQSILPDGWLDNANIERIIVHWTAGSTSASSVDKSHYHFMIEEDGTVVQGNHRPSANSKPRPSGRSYAAHTLNCNSGSIGLAICGMAGANESPFRKGSHPFNELQWSRMAQVAAQICHHYGLPVTEKTVLGHGEVQNNLNIRQRGKWDPMVLPWDPSLSKAEVGKKMRADVNAALFVADDDDLVLMDASVLGTSLKDAAASYDVKHWLALPSVSEKLNWKILDDEAGDGVVLRVEAFDIFVPSFIHKDPGTNTETVYLDAQELAEALELVIDVKVSKEGDVLFIGGKVGGDVDEIAGRNYRLVTVKKGDYLTKIAERLLGDKDRWIEILDDQGIPFDADSARRIAPGQQVRVPDAGSDESAASAKETLSINESEYSGIADAISLVVRERVNRDRARAMVPYILSACADLKISDRAHIAYMFATAEHETNFGKHMTEIWNNSAAQKRYQGKYGNDKRGDGKKYRGRGSVQLTFKSNYERFGKALGVDLVGKPEDAADPKIAAKILAIGMTKLGYRGSNFVLSRYGFEEKFDFEAARAVVNNDVNIFENRYGAKRGEAIGEQARKYYEILRSQGTG